MTTPSGRGNKNETLKAITYPELVADHSIFYS